MISRLPHEAALRAALILALAAGGCTPYRTFDLPTDPAHAQQSREESSGLTTAAQLIVDPRLVERYFGPEFLDEHFFAVIVYLENRGTASFEFDRQDFALVLEDGFRFAPVSPREILTEAARSALRWDTALLAPLIFPVVLAYQHAQEYNFDMGKSLQQKAFPPAIRLEPSDAPLVRAIFFRDPAGSSRNEDEFDSAVLQFVAEIEGSPPQDGAAPTSRLVGRVVTFTVSLTRREI